MWWSCSEVFLALVGVAAVSAGWSGEGVDSDVGGGFDAFGDVAGDAAAAAFSQVCGSAGAVFDGCCDLRYGVACVEPFVDLSGRVGSVDEVVFWCAAEFDGSGWVRPYGLVRQVLRSTHNRDHQQEEVHPEVQG